MRRRVTSILLVLASIVGLNVAVVAAPAQAADSGQVSGWVTQNQTLTLTAPVGSVFISVDYASFGNGTNYSKGTCDSATSVSAVSKKLLGRNSAKVVANVATFGDPCPGVNKRPSTNRACALRFTRSRRREVIRLETTPPTPPAMAPGPLSTMSGQTGEAAWLPTASPSM